MPYIFNTQDDISKMAKTIAIDSVDSLFAHLPEKIKLKTSLNLERGLSEREVKAAVEGLARKNRTISEFNSFLGAGVYQHYIPEALSYIISNPQFTTAYTPYQAEISQGILQTIYEYQSYISLLTAMDVTNASLFDGASSLAEAVLMSLRINKRQKIVLAQSIHPEYRQTVETYLAGFNYQISIAAINKEGKIDRQWLKDNLDNNCACLAIQSPNFLGVIEDTSDLANLVHDQGGVLIMVTDPYPLAVLKEPKELGVDIVCGDGQPLGGSLGFGGSSLGFLATKEEYLRQMPGRIVGRTTDQNNRIAYCLTLQAREQHIRREKATSNICSNQSLHAFIFTVYLALIGQEGFKKNMVYSANLSHYLYERLKKIEAVNLPLTGPFINEFVWRIDKAQLIIDYLYKKGIIAGFNLGTKYPEYKDCILSCCTETKSKKDIDKFITVLKQAIKKVNSLCLTD